MRKTKSEVLEAVHETARGLHKAGVMDQSTLCEFHRLCLPHIVESRYVSNYTIWLRFNDGVEGEVNLAPQLFGEIFKPLKNIKYFCKFKIHPEFHTLVWPSGADFAPEFLRAALRTDVRK